MDWRSRDLVPGKKKKSGKSALIISVLVSLLLAWLIRILVHSFYLLPVTLPDTAMEPAYPKGYVVYVYRSFSGNLEPGTTILTEHPQSSDLQMIRRIVAVPGDTISMQSGILMRNGLAVQEEWQRNAQASWPAGIAADDPAAYSWLNIEPQTLGADQYFVLADNRYEWLDSRFFGPVRSSMIQGRIED